MTGATQLLLMYRSRRKLGNTRRLLPGSQKDLKNRNFPQASRPHRCGDVPKGQPAGKRWRTGIRAWPISEPCREYTRRSLAPALVKIDRGQIQSQSACCSDLIQFSERGDDKSTINDVASNAFQTADQQAGLDATGTMAAAPPPLRSPALI
jgi:hypothetical protein